MTTPLYLAWNAHGVFTAALTNSHSRRRTQVLPSSFMPFLRLSALTSLGGHRPGQRAIASGLLNGAKSVPISTTSFAAPTRSIPEPSATETAPATPQAPSAQPADRHRTLRSPPPVARYGGAGSPARRCARERDRLRARRRSPRAVSRVEGLREAEPLRVQLHRSVNGSSRVPTCR